MGRTKKENGKAKEAEKQADFAQLTLTGDVRDALISCIRGFRPELNETEQARVITRCHDVAALVVGQAIKITASRGFRHVPVRFSTKFEGDLDGGLVLAVSHSGTAQDRELLLRQLGGNVLIIPLELHEFTGERKAAEPDVVGDLRMPKTPAPVDQPAEEFIGRGKREPNPGEVGPMMPEADTTHDLEHMR